MLAFAARTVAHPIVVMTSVDRALDGAPAPRQVGEEAHSWGEAAWLGDAVGICWDGDPGGFGALRMREIAGLDGALGPRRDFEPGDGPCMDLTWAHDRYGMTWRSERDVDGIYTVDSVFQVFGRDGAPFGERIVLTTAPYPGRTPTVLADDDGFVVVTTMEDAIRVVRVSPGGIVLRDDTIGAASASYVAPALRDGELGMLILVGEPESRALLFSVFDASMDAEYLRVLEDGAPTASQPRLLARPEGWVAVWGVGSRPTDELMMLSVGPDLVPLAPRQVLYGAANSGYGGPSLLSVDESVYVGLSRFSDDAPGTRESVWVERWDCTEPPRDPCAPDDAVPDGRCSADHWLGYAWNGRTCEPVHGCLCRGADCARLPVTRYECESDRTECPAASCGSLGASATELCGTREVAARTPSTVDLAFAVPGCLCAEPRCRVLVSGPRELSLDVESCSEVAEPCDCTPPPDGAAHITCDLPPMQEGDWTLRMEGGLVPLVVRPPWETPDLTPTCSPVSIDAGSSLDSAGARG